MILVPANGDNAELLQGIPVATDTPAGGDVLTFDETAGEWGPAAPAAAPVSSVLGQTGDVTLSELVAQGVAPLASPALAGTPTVPTAAAGTGTAQAASCAFVLASQTRTVTFGLSVTAPGGTPSPLTVANDVTPHVVLQRAGAFQRVDVQAKTGPVGAALVLDLKKSSDGGATWASLWATNPGHRPQVASGATSGSQTSFDTATFAAGDLLRLDVIQVGSTTAGNDVTVSLLCTGG